MANQEHLDRLKRGVAVWNKWREEYLEIQPDLRDADLTGAYLRKTNLEGAHLEGANLTGAYLRKTNLKGAHLSEAHLEGANLRRANLSEAHLEGANLRRANLSEAHLEGANLTGANLRRNNLESAHLTGANFEGADLTGANFEDADLTEAHLEGADLSEAVLVRTNLHKAILTNCRVYGIAAWDVDVTEADQSNLIITDPQHPIITVDNLKVAQFIYLLLNNQEIREVINTIGQKGVLILGRFSQERKLVLDALREKLRTLNFLPIVFDFERPTERDITETIMTLAGLCSFIIADITNPKLSPLELQAAVPNYMIPFVPLIQKGEQPFSMFKDLKNKYNWVLDPLAYDTPSNLIEVLEIAVVKPALEKRAELLAKKVEQVRIRDADDYLKQLH